MTTEAQKRATAKYQSRVYEQIKISVKKGWRDKVKAAAKKSGESMTSYIVNATEARLNERD